MVYGNTGDESGSGVAFTAPIRPTGPRSSTASSSSTPRERTSSPACAHAGTGRRAEKADAQGLPGARAHPSDALRKHFKDVQDFEFTIEDGTVYMLQTRKRQAHRDGGRWRRFLDGHDREKLIDWKTAVMRNPADQLEQLLAPVFDTSDVASNT